MRQTTATLTPTFTAAQRAGLEGLVASGLLTRMPAPLVAPLKVPVIPCLRGVSSAEILDDLRGNR